MAGFFEDFPEKPSKKASLFWRAAGLGLVIGGLLVATIFFYFGEAIFSQNKKNEAPFWFSPGTEGENHNSLNLENNSEISPEAIQYYMAVVKAAEKVTPSVVGISNYGVVYDFWGRGSLREIGTGSGVIIGSDGYVVTNYHVIENARELVVTLGTGEEFPAEVVGTDPPTDIAVIKIDKKGLPAVEFADSDALRVGEPAIAIGNPLGLAFQQSVTVGVVSALERSITIQGQRFTFIQTDAAINEGNSGGALVNIYGKLIGINTAKIKLPGVEGMGFAIPANTVKTIVSELIEKGRVIRPWLGVYIATLSPWDAQRLDLGVEYGVLVTDVVAGSPAQKAGIKNFDVIIKIEGEEITSTAALQEVLYRFKVNEKIKITIVREKKEMVVEVTLEKMPEQ